MRSSPQLDMIVKASGALGPLNDNVVFVGGSVLCLLLTDESAATPRPTEDVDVIIEIASRKQYYELEDKLRNLGFQQDPFESNICRWRIEDLAVDIMPIKEEILGFTNDWYLSAMTHGTRIELPNRMVIARIDAPHFVATKLSAFRDRGGGDMFSSVDMEDVVTILDGRPELIEEVSLSPADLLSYLASEARRLLEEQHLESAIEGHLRTVLNSAARVPIVLDRIRLLTEIKG